MPRERSFFFGLLVLATIGLLWGWITGEPRELVRTSLVPGIPSSDEPNGRRWRAAPLTELLSNHADEDELEAPANGLAVGPEGEIYLLRTLDRSVVSLPGGGRPALRFAPDASVRPSPIDLEVAPDGALWVTYSKAEAVARYGPEGQLLRWEHPNVPPRRAVPWSEDGYAVLSGSPGDHLFEGYGGAQGRSAAFGRLTRGKQHPLFLEGDLAADGRGGFVYAGFRAGLLAAWGPDGSARFRKRTVDATPLPTLVKAEGGRRQYLEPGSPVASIAAAVDGDAVYVLSAAGPGASKNRPAVDVYDLEDGSYRHSFEAPPGAVHVDVRGGVLYTLHEDRVRAWRLDPAEPPPPGPASAPEPAG